MIPVVMLPKPITTDADRWDLPDTLLVPMESLDAYFARIHAIPVLSADEEMVLGEAVQHEDRDAAIRLATHNLRYAAHLARKWEGRTTAEAVWSLGDAVQAANIGLWTAAQRFDPRVARFSTLATWWIRQAWNRARNDFLWQVRLPAHAAEEWRAYQRAVTTWSASHGTDPTSEELADFLGWPIHRVAFWAHWAVTNHRPASLDALLLDGDTPFGDMLAAPEDSGIWSQMTQLAQKDAVDQLLEQLTPREADVLRLRYGIAGAPMTLQEVGEVFHLTRERIRQIEAHALKKLREAVGRHPEWDLRALIS